MNKIISIFPHVVDNTMRETLIRCEKAAYWNHERGLKTIGINPDLHAGHAFARGIEVARKEFWVEGKDAYDSVLKGVEALYENYGNFIYPADRFKNRSAERMAGALTYYFEQWPFKRENAPVLLEEGYAIEKGFGIEIPVFHPDETNLKYGMKPDLIEIRDGVVWGVDEKSGGSLSDAWVNQWTMNSQITGYCWGIPQLLKQNGVNLPFGGIEIRGVGITPTKYSHMAIQVLRMPWEIKRWYQQMHFDMIRWVQAHGHGDHDLALGHACAMYNDPCDYQKLCKAHDPEYLIEGNYTVRHWNPLDDSTR